MNLTPLAPLVVGLVLSLIPFFSRNEKHKQDGVNSIYGYPKVAGYIVLFIALLFAASPLLMPLIPRRNHDAGPMPIELPMLTTLAAVFIYIYLTRYRVILDREKIRCGSLFIREFKYADITRVMFIGAAAKGQYRIYASSSRWPMTIFSSIVDFAAFLEEIKARLPKNVKIE